MADDHCIGQQSSRDTLSIAKNSKEDKKGGGGKQQCNVKQM